MNATTRVYRRLNDAFASSIDAAFANQFGTELRTTFNVIKQKLESLRADGRKFTKEQATWVESFSKGYMVAMGNVAEKESKA